MTEKKLILDPVNKSRLHEEIVGQIQERIIKGELKIGDKLPSERDLAQSLNVNRATVREALKKLEFLGLVNIQHGNGIYVKNYYESGNLELLEAIMDMDKGLNAKGLNDLLQVRKIITPEMASMAAENRTDKEIKLMEELLEDDSMSLLQKDLKMHRLVAQASKNIFYIFILNFFNKLFEDYGYLYFENKENEERTVKFHKDIFNAILNKKSAKAKKVMYDVLVYTENKINQRLK